jgi:hypothetical protein
LPADAVRGLGVSDNVFSEATACVGKIPGIDFSTGLEEYNVLNVIKATNDKKNMISNAIEVFDMISI